MVEYSDDCQVNPSNIYTEMSLRLQIWSGSLDYDSNLNIIKSSISVIAGTVFLKAPGITEQPVNCRAIIRVNKMLLKMTNYFVDQLNLLLFNSSLLRLR